MVKLFRERCQVLNDDCNVPKNDDAPEHSPAGTNISSQCCKILVLRVTSICWTRRCQGQEDASHRRWAGLAWPVGALENSILNPELFVLEDSEL